MFDANLLFFNAATVTTTTNAVLSTAGISKTPARGVDVEIVITAIAGSTTGRTIDGVLAESDDGTTYGNVVTFPQMTTTGRVFRRYKSKKAYHKLTLTCGTGTGLSATLTAGVVSGEQRDVSA
jgi:hypothetical protein